MKNTQVKLLNHTKYVGSGSSKIVHKTTGACEDAYRIPPDERWYINKIHPNFIKCPKCFGLEEKDSKSNEDRNLNSTKELKPQKTEKNLDNKE